MPIRYGCSDVTDRGRTRGRLGMGRVPDALRIELPAADGAGRLAIEAPLALELEAFAAWLDAAHQGA